MPNKFSVRHRAWGTRFDSLPLTSPSPSSKATESDVDRATPVDVVQPVPDASNTLKGDDRMPHDTSIFVGSLPVNVEPKELSRLLSQHLADYGEIRSVKVIRDSKGGICAFVQCKDAPAAANLIHTLNTNPPRPFFGRSLRFEVARAFRSLLISYCVPTEKLLTQNTGMENQVETTVELELPYAMRIWKLRNTRTCILYNDNAAEANKAQNVNCERLLHLEPVKFDSKTLEAICVQFGPLEYFKSYKFSNANTSFPFPHNAPRSPNMDPGCFEIKWLHRDDAVNAFSTLRSMVPHLSVSWLHQHERQTGQGRQIARFPPTILPAPKARKPIPNLTRSSPTSAWLEIDFPPLGDLKPERKAKPNMEPSKPKIENPHRKSTDSSMIYDLSGAALAAETDVDVNPHPPTYSYRDENVDTPQLGMSPVTPKTPTSGFPPTPTSSNGDYKSPTFVKFSDDNRFTPSEHGVPEKSILDPTTLFVGGLEMFGPGAWDETKLHKFFERFGGLEDVQMIKPTTGRTAFAFVKFDNTDSPTRAIIEENNQVYQGRTLRVQLRDFNPTRGNWKPGRGRGRYFNYGGHVRRQGFNFANGNPQTESEAGTEHDSASLLAEQQLKPDEVDIQPQVPISETKEVEDPEPVPDSMSTSIPIEESTAPETSQTNDKNVENFREWYEAEVPPPLNQTPPHVSFAPVELPAGPCQMPPPPGYYSGAPWMHPYPPYPVSYGPGYPPVYPASNGVPYTGSDASNSIMSSNTWPGMYGTYIPYPTYPLKQSTTEQASSQASLGQPPVIPQGFIHNEQGGLIAVYGPEVVNQYAQGNQLTPQPHITQAPFPPPVGLPGPQAMQNWTQFPPCPPVIPGQAPRSVPPMNPQIPPPNPIGVGLGMGNWISSNLSLPFLQRPPAMALPLTNGGSMNKRGRKDHFTPGNKNFRHGQRNGRGFGDQDMGRSIHNGNGEWNKVPGGPDSVQCYV